jgi:hypothetical protein
MSFCFEIFNLRQIRVESYNQIQFVFLNQKKTKFPVRHHYQAYLNLSTYFLLQSLKSIELVAPVLMLAH